MAVVRIRIYNHDYDIACDNGQEDHLRFLADEVDGRVRSLVRNIGSNPGEVMTLLLLALTLSDEVIENKKENNKMAEEIRYLSAVVKEDQKPARPERMMEIETAMAVTLEEIALKIEKIADRIELV